MEKDLKDTFSSTAEPLNFSNVLNILYRVRCNLHIFHLSDRRPLCAKRRIQDSGCLLSPLSRFPQDSE